MANLLCFIEHHHGDPTPCSLEVLGQARRIATGLGATLYAAVALERAPGYGDDDILAKLASGGADKILLIVGETFGTLPTEATWETHGPAVAMAWDVCQPAIALLPATGAGRELAPRAAARVGAAYLHEAFVDMRDGALLIGEGHGQGARLLHEVDFPVVATISAARYAVAAGDEEAEVEVLQAQGAPRFSPRAGERQPLPLRAQVAVPDGFPPLPAPLSDAVRTVSPTPNLAIVELATASGPLRIALGNGATEVEQADFAAEGDAAELLERLFSTKDGAKSQAGERRR